MRAALAMAILGVSACSHQAPPTPAASPQGGTVTGQVSVVSPDSMQRLRAAAPAPSPAQRAFTSRFDSLAALVDTIVILHPDSVVLHVGQAFDPFSVRHEARRADGQPLPTYPGSIDVADRSIADMTQAGLVGVAVGRTCLVFSVMGYRVHLHPTCLPVRVIP